MIPRWLVSAGWSWASRRIRMVWDGLVGPRSSVSNIGPRAHSTLKIFVCVSWYKQRKAILFFRKAAYRFATCCKGVVCTFDVVMKTAKGVLIPLATSEFLVTWSCQCKPAQAESGCRAFARENPVSSVAPPTLTSVGRHRGASRGFETLEIGQNYIELIASDTTVESIHLPSRYPEFLEPKI